MMPPHWRRDASRARWPSCRLCPCGPCASSCQRADAPVVAVVACVPNRPAWPGWLACRLSVLARRAKWHAGRGRQDSIGKCRSIRYGTLKTVRPEGNRSRSASCVCASGPPSSPASVKPRRPSHAAFAGRYSMAESSRWHEQGHRVGGISIVWKARGFQR